MSKVVSSPCKLTFCQRLLKKIRPDFKEPVLINGDTLAKMDKNETLTADDWNQELARLLIPNNIILSLYIIAGIFGNGFVIFVYGFRMKGKKEERYFIPYLASTDLAASVICASMGLTLNLLQAKFENQELCKAWWFFAAFTTYMSVLMLLIIAVHRYRKICRPLGPQMTRFWKRLAMVLSFCIATVMSGPISLFYGVVPFQSQDHSITGTRCSKLDGNRTGSLVYGVILILILLSMIISLISIYTIIGCTIYRHFKNSESLGIRSVFKKDKKSGKSSIGKETSESESNITTENTLDTAIIQEGMATNCKQQGEGTSEEMKTYKETEVLQNKVPVSVILHKESVETEAVPSPGSKTENVMTKSLGLHNKTNRRIMYKFTLIYMLITIIFLVCYIPKVILMVIEGLNSSFWEDFSDAERPGVLFIYRMYIINNIANPIIYGFLDKQFRKELKKCLKCA